MNRIRKICNNRYQVLLTPTQDYNSGWELVRASFSLSDQYLRNYTILEFDNLADAECEAFQHPDIDWDSMVLLHENAFIDLRKKIKHDLDKWKFIVEFNPLIVNSLTLKNNIFDRVMIYGKRFNLSYQMNDIISFHIINPWSENINDIAFVLESNVSLRIAKRIKTYGMITLIGMTDLSTTYEICIWPTILYNWTKWIKLNNITDEKIKDDTLKQSLKLQQEIDKSLVIR